MTHGSVAIGSRNHQLIDFDKTNYTRLKKRDEQTVAHGAAGRAAFEINLVRRGPVNGVVRLGGAMDEEIAEIVRNHGWYAANVNDADPPFFYTIGLMETCRHPEFIILGLDADNAYALFAGLIAEIRNGASYSVNGVRTIELEGDKHRVAFRRVHPTQHPLYLGFAMGFLTNVGRMGELNAMQAFWPDSNGKFPIDAGCDLSVYNLQPRLDIELTPREIREFERRWE